MACSWCHFSVSALALCLALLWEVAGSAESAAPGSDGDGAALNASAGNASSGQGSSSGVKAEELGDDVRSMYWGSLQGSFTPVEGGQGRACRGASPDDGSSKDYEAMTEVPSLDVCKSLCIDSGKCTGIEYSEKIQICEIWTMKGGPNATVAADGFTCLAHHSANFEPADGGIDRGCRGPGLVEEYPNMTSFSACTSFCAAEPRCKGVEYATAKLGKQRAGNCKLYEGDEGITWTIWATGYMCFKLEREARRLLLV